MAYAYETHNYDVVVVGAGGAGLRATLGMAEQGLRTACVNEFGLMFVRAYVVCAYICVYVHADTSLW